MQNWVPSERLGTSDKKPSMRGVSSISMLSYEVVCWEFHAPVSL